MPADFDGEMTHSGPGYETIVVDDGIGVFRSMWCLALHPNRRRRSTTKTRNKPCTRGLGAIFCGNVVLASPTEQ